MGFRSKWRLGNGEAVEIARFSNEQAPSDHDIRAFLIRSRQGPSPYRFRMGHYVWRESEYAVAWLTTYIRHHVADLRDTFVRPDKSFYIAFLEYADPPDRAVSFRLTTAGLDGHTEWRAIVRKSTLDGDDGFWCGE